MTGVLNDETQAIENNKTWELTQSPANRSHIALKWVYKKKYNQMFCRQVQGWIDCKLIQDKSLELLLWGVCSLGKTS